MEKFISSEHQRPGEGRSARQPFTRRRLLGPFRRRGHEEGAAAPHAPTSLGRRAADLESSLERFTAPRLGAFSIGVVWARELGAAFRGSRRTPRRARISRANMVELASRRRRGVVRGRCGGEHHRPRRRPALAQQHPTLASDDKALGRTRHAGIQISRRRRRRHPRARQEDSGKPPSRCAPRRRAPRHRPGRRGAKCSSRRYARTRSRPPPPGFPTAHPNPSHLEGHRHRLRRGHVRRHGSKRRGQDHPPRHHQQAQDRGQGSRQGEKTHSCAPAEDAAFSPPRNPAPDRRHLSPSPPDHSLVRYTSTVSFPPSRR